MPEASYVYRNINLHKTFDYSRSRAKQQKLILYTFESSGFGMTFILTTSIGLVSVKIPVKKTTGFQIVETLLTIKIFIR